MKSTKMVSTYECPRCGAPLKGNVCEYCGGAVNIAESDGQIVHLKLGNEEIRCYIGEAHTEYCTYKETGRDIYGRLVRYPAIKKRVFKLIEI